MIPHVPHIPHIPHTLHIGFQDPRASYTGVDVFFEKTVELPYQIAPGLELSVGDLMFSIERVIAFCDPTQPLEVVVREPLNGLDRYTAEQLEAEGFRCSSPQQLEAALEESLA